MRVGEYGFVDIPCETIEDKKLKELKKITALLRKQVKLMEGK